MTNLLLEGQLCLVLDGMLITPDYQFHVRELKEGVRYGAQRCTTELFSLGNSWMELDRVISLNDDDISIDSSLIKFRGQDIPLSFHMIDSIRDMITGEVYDNIEDIEILDYTEEDETSTLYMYNEIPTEFKECLRRDRAKIKFDAINFTIHLYNLEEWMKWATMDLRGNVYLSAKRPRKTPGCLVFGKDNPYDVVELEFNISPIEWMNSDPVEITNYF